VLDSLSKDDPPKRGAVLVADPLDQSAGVSAQKLADLLGTQSGQRGPKRLVDLSVAL
jgi:hypothetical protein